MKNTRISTGIDCLYGNIERRTAKLTLQSGRVTFTLGDKSEVELFNFITGNTGDLSYV